MLCGVGCVRMVDPRAAPPKGWQADAVPDRSVATDLRCPLPVGLGPSSSRRRLRREAVEPPDRRRERVAAVVAFSDEGITKRRLPKRTPIGNQQGEVAKKIRSPAPHTHRPRQGARTHHSGPCPEHRQGPFRGREVAAAVAAGGPCRARGHGLVSDHGRRRSGERGAYPSSCSAFSHPSPRASSRSKSLNCASM